MLLDSSSIERVGNYGRRSSGSRSHGGPSNYSFFFSLNIVVLSPLVSRSARFVNVGQKLHVVMV